MSGLVKTLDTHISDIHASFVKSRHPYEHIADCLRLAFAMIHRATLDFDLRIKVSLASLGQMFMLAAIEALSAKRNNEYPTTFG